MPRLPRRPRAHRLARQRARARRPGVRRLPPASTRSATRCSRRPTSPRSASPVTGRSAPTSRRTSTHPVRFGLMGCSDCHSPHGSTTVAMLNKPTLNQTCFSCHADKRGPMLWEHAPVAEDCSLCHTAHGSVRSALLNKSPPLLCQQCHTVADHPSVARTERRVARQWRRRLDLPDRGRLHQLPFAGPRFEPPCRSQADAVKAVACGQAARRPTENGREHENLDHLAAAHCLRRARRGRRRARGRHLAMEVRELPVREGHERHGRRRHRHRERKLGQVRRLHRARQARRVRHPRRHRSPSRRGRLLGPRRGDQPRARHTGDRRAGRPRGAVQPAPRLFGDPAPLYRHRVDAVPRRRRRQC